MIADDDYQHPLFQFYKNKKGIIREKRVIATKVRKTENFFFKYGKQREPSMLQDFPSICMSKLRTPLKQPKQSTREKA